MLGLCGGVKVAALGVALAATAVVILLVPASCPEAGRVGDCEAKRDPAAASLPDPVLSVNTSCLGMSAWMLTRPIVPSYAAFGTIEKSWTPDSAGIRIAERRVSVSERGDGTADAEPIANLRAPVAGPDSVKETM